MVRKSMLFVALLFVLGSLSYGQNYASLKLRSVVFPHPVKNTLSFAPAGETYLAQDLSSKFFWFASAEYHKYFYLPADYPVRRPGLLGGVGFRNKNIAIRFGVGSSENTNWTTELVVKLGNRVDRKDFIWYLEGGFWYGEDNLRLYGDVLASANLVYQIYDAVEIGLGYQGKKNPTMTSSHWWGPKVRGEVDDNWYVVAELQKWQKNIFGAVGLQIILL